jgi:ferrochelatase
MPAELPPFDAVLLLSFGGPEGPQDVRPFLENVTRGREIPEARLQEVEAQYALFGGVSPINEECRKLQGAFEAELAGSNHPLPVYWGNRNWPPMLKDTLRGMGEAGVRRALVLATSAFSSYSGCRQYQEDLDRATEELLAEGSPVPALQKIRPYWNHPGFIETVIAHSAQALAEVSESRESTRLLFTAHSIPLSMAAGCNYETQLREAARVVAESVAPDCSWDLVFQSRSGPPSVPWLEPDICDFIAELNSEEAADSSKVEALVVIPLGFVADHMEVKYDLDTRARAMAEQQGLSFSRARTVGDAARFVRGLRELVEEYADGAAALKVGRLDAAPAQCAPDCCTMPKRR